MKTQSIILCFLLMQSSMFAASSMRQAANILPADVNTSCLQHPFGDRIKRFLTNQEKSTSFTPTGFSNRDYLVQIERQVRAFYPHQNKETGAIIDPVYKIEWQYSTPSYTLSVGLLYKTGFIRDGQLLKSGTQALDCSITEMHENRCAHHHGEFFIQPIMVALDLYREYVSDEQIMLWRNKIATGRTYQTFSNRI